MDNQQHKIFFDANGHLSHEAIAWCAQKMLRPGSGQPLQDSIMMHLDVCEQCNEKVLDLYQLMLTANKPGHIVRFQSGRFMVRDIFFAAKKPLSLIASVAAIILLLIVFTRVFYSDSVDAGELFAQHFTPYPNLHTIKGDVENQLAKAMLYYDVKDYDSAIILFEEILKHSPDSETAVFYLGNAYLANGEASRAAPLFEQLLSEESRFSEAGLWYLSLSYLKQGEIEKAKILLDEIAHASAYYGKKAEALLGELD